MAPKPKEQPEAPDTSVDHESVNPSAAEVTASFSSTQSHAVDAKPQSSPLLSSTPPIVSKALVRAYPYLLIVNKLLSIITWTNDDYWVNVVLISAYALVVLYFEALVTWFGHLLIVGFITLYALLNKKILQEANLHPSLDEVIQALTNTCLKADRLLDPIISLSLTAYDIKRLLFTTVFLTPIYLIVSFLLIQPRTILLVTGVYLLTYHSAYSSVTRKMIWKLRLTRVLFFYLTGLDFSRQRNHSLFAAAFAKVQKNAGHSLNPLSSKSNRPVRFTYVIYENQRRWLGIGWTSNLLSYERTPWTDEFLNESSSIDSFKLPNPENHQQYSFGSEQSSQLSMNNARWRWVDKSWRLDLTNDGAVTLPPGKRSKTTANPGSDEGFIYYDNTWKRPTTDDSYSKYTRRRRWIRTAELVFDNDNDDDDISTYDPADEDTPKVKKNLRFAEPVPETDEEKEESRPSDLIDMEDIKSSKQQTDTVSSILEKLEVAPQSITKEVLTPVLTTDLDTSTSDIEDIKSVNPVSDPGTIFSPGNPPVDDKKNV
ncbi:hypothetical protein PSN45_002277 [Yamadazyma tenuis]|uniref:Peroxin/Ferlin domain-containing protein n=1 Tax=Candida tenuis (strain ATCC 10573 / BCRC 21748 / CBS 615 / JCM 9827 / NBRC 10315 / NRRL Y-1498 / VKM Y-70) TaxID=590646 RepID=G3BF22_CANTC|nr:uncharacterized protein CANTEDRAFT_126721 [Yamadazyma tenuis ATCC 10573]EGV59991.1 hypothetical protein CANTEDRAFT_126721 [Yamadazyma tenuis ATCC 10573]WEJ94781.1 hypothetical protein PSN45_002277 [Yamadazyma tenuis]